MNNYFKACLFFIIIQSSFAQEKTKTDRVFLKEINQQYKELQNKRTTLDSTNMYTHKLMSTIKNRISKNNFTTDSLAKEIKHVYAKSIVYLEGTVLTSQAEFDSVLYYNDKIIRNYTTDPYYLGRSESIASFAHYHKNDFSNYIISIKKAIQYFSNSNHRSANFRKAQLYLELLDFYNNYNLDFYTETILPLAENELEIVKQERNIENLELHLKLIKGNLLINKGETEKALEIFKVFETIEIPNPYYAVNTYYDLLGTYINLEMSEKAMLFYNKLYNNNKIEIQLSENITEVKNLFLTEIYLLKQEINNAKKQFYLFEKDSVNSPHNNLSIQLKLAKYHEIIKKPEIALKHYKRFFDLRDSINKSGLDIVHRANSYEFGFEKELLTLKSKNKQKEAIISADKKILGAVIVILILLGGLLTTIVYFVKNKRNQTTKLKLEKSEEINIVKNTFLENISHEVRTPITIINGYLSLLKESILEPKKVLEYSNLISKNTDGLINTLNNFLTLFKTQNTHTLKPKKEVKDLNDFCRNTIVDFKALCEVKKINIHYKTNIKNKLEIEYDFYSLQKIIYNIVSNAIKYSNSNTSIFVSFSLIQNGFQITVKDEGIGIAKEEQEHIFKRFYQSEKHLRTGGFGIGLAYVEELITNLNGTVVLESKLNVGSIFTIKLPIPLDKFAIYTNEINSDYELLNTKTEEVENLNLPKILIVDDNIEMVSYYKELFSPFLNCSFAFNGKEALKKANSDTFKIIISDLRMPIMDGAQFKTALNKIPAYKEVPFIMITAVSYNTDDDYKMTLGINEYISKPFHKDEIIVRIKNLLEKDIYRSKAFETLENNIEFVNTYSVLIEKIKTIIQENINNSDFNVKFLAQECGYEQKQLNRILQAKMGLTSLQVILEIRLLEAYDAIIKNKYKTISEVMYSVGFNSRPYFYKKFEQRFGIKPGDLKKKYFA